MGTAPLHQPDQAVDAKLGIDLDQTVNVIRHDFHFDDVRLALLRHFAKDGLQPFLNLSILF